MRGPRQFRGPAILFPEMAGEFFGQRQLIDLIESNQLEIQPEVPEIPVEPATT